MTQEDEIVEEVRAVREAYAAQFDYDIRKIFEDMQMRENAGNHSLADLLPLEPHP